MDDEMREVLLVGGTQVANDPEFDEKGYGMLNRFRKYQKRSEEEVKLSLVRFASHEYFTYHLPVGANFNRRSVLPAEQMRGLREMAAKIKWKNK